MEHYEFVRRQSNFFYSPESALAYAAKHLGATGMKVEIEVCYANTVAHDGDPDEMVWYVEMYELTLIREMKHTPVPECVDDRLLGESVLSKFPRSNPPVVTFDDEE